MLTGDLNHEYQSQPAYPFQERYLLRAQLARIHHACFIVPKGVFEIDEETQKIKFAEGDPPDVSTEGLKSLENWVHYPSVILKAGRCTHIAPTDMDEDAAKEIMDKLAEEDPVIERFKQVLQEDKPQDDKQPNWASKVAGDTAVYNKIGGGETTLSYAVNIISSGRWPGAVTVAKGGQFCNIYVGDAIKRGDNFFNPTEPGEV